MFARLFAAFLALFAKKPTVAAPIPTYTPTPEPVKRSTGKGAAIGGVAGAATIAAIVAFIGPWEGRRYTAYQDIVGVWTICEGHTKGVKAGDVANDAQCDAMTAQDVAEHNAGIRACITRPMPQNVEIAFTSLAFNAGVGAFCGSTALRRYNAGDDSGACDALNMWNRAGNKVVRGLVNRRAAESALCKKDST